jgi:hypothetical protein
MTPQTTVFQAERLSENEVFEKLSIRSLGDKPEEALLDN